MIDPPAVCGWQPHLPEFSHEFRPIVCGARWFASRWERMLPLVLSGYKIFLLNMMMGSVFGSLCAEQEH